MKTKFHFLLSIFLTTSGTLCQAQQETMKYAEFSPDGTLILLADFDSLKYRLFDATSKKFIQEIKTGFIKPEPELPNDGGTLPDFIPSFAMFSPDGKSVYLIFDHSIINWDIIQKKIAFKDNEAYYLDMSRDGLQLVLRKGKSIQVYNTKTWKVSKSIKSEGSAKISPDGKSLAVRINHPNKKSEIKLIDIASGKIIKTITAKEYISYLGYSSDGKTFLATSFDINGDVTYALYFWEAATGKLLDTLSGDNTPFYSPDGKKIITLTPDIIDNYGFADNFATVWNADNRKLAFKLEGHSGNLTAAKFSPDSRRIVTSSDDGVAIIWDAGTGERLLNLERYSIMVVLGFDSNSKFVLTASSEAVHVWELKTGILLYTLNGENIVNFPYEEGNPFEKSVEALKETIRLDPTATKGYIELGELYERNRYYTKAVENYEKISAIDPSATAGLIKLGDMYKLKNDYENSAISYQKAIDANPSGTDGYFKLGDLHFFNREYDQAIDQYNKAYKKDTSLFITHYHLGRAYLEKKENERAIQEFLQVTKHFKGRELQVSKSITYLRFGSVYMDLATAYERVGNQQLAAISNAKGYLIQGDIVAGYMEKVLFWLEKAAKAGYNIASDSFFYEYLEDNVQYRKLLAQYPKKG